MKRLVALHPGGPELLVVDDAPTPTPGPRDALVAIAYSGVNFIDVYFRVGLYKADAPIVLGSEGAGTVETVGSGVTEVVPGDRVVYAMHRGSHAEYAVVPATALAKIPDAVDFRTAAAAMLQGTTGHYLTHSTFPISSEHTSRPCRRRRRGRHDRPDGEAGPAPASSARRQPKPRRARRGRLARIMS
jgi:NADPH2:quinone reductase